jgi:hypothetical protein
MSVAIVKVTLERIERRWAIITKATHNQQEDF